MIEKRKDSTKEPNQNQINSKRILKECQTEAYLLRPNKRQIEILEIMGTREMTARQICESLMELDMNYVRPRLTELIEKEKVEVIGKTKDNITGRTVSVYRRLEI